MLVAGDRFEIRGACELNHCQASCRQANWANAQGKSWRLFLLFNVLAKCLEAFICDLGQRNAVDLIDPIDPVFNSLGIRIVRRASFFDLGQFLEGLHLLHTNIYGNAEPKLRHFAEIERISRKSRGTRLARIVN